MAKQLATVDLVAPGIRGLNREARNRLLPPEYATLCTNFRLNKDGLLSSRKGQTDQTSTAITATPNVETLHEYIDSAGTSEILVGWDGGIGNNIDNPEGNDVSGSLVDTSGTWWMQNFNDKCLAFQDGQKLAVYTGTTFATVTEGSGTAPSSGIAAAIFGRVYQVDDTDGGNILYCGLLDETDWGGTSSGNIDLNKVWIAGQDRVTAIAAFNGSIVVFGINHIVFIVDGTGSELGLDPSAAYVADVIAGTGCVDQNTVQHVGESDLIFLSPNGIQSLQRIISSKSNPVTTLSRAIDSDLLTAYRNETAGQIRSAFSQDEGLYVITFPDAGKTYAFDIRRKYRTEDGTHELAPVFEWTLAPTSWVAKEDGTLLMGGAGSIYSYDGNTDAASATIDVVYDSPWLELGEEFGNRLKILKKIGATIFTSLDGSVVYRWAKDFNTNYSTYTDTLSAPGGASEWGTSLWGTDEWSGALGIVIRRVPARDTGQYFKIGLTASLDTPFTIQQIELLAKLGRLA
jgi:hypothetical protein